MVELQINLDDRQVTASVNRLVRRTPALSRQILGELGEAIVARTNTHYLSGQVLKRKTGTLAKSVNYRYNNDWSINVGSNVRYAAIHEFGGEIFPKNGMYLAFQIEGNWIFAKKVVIPKRPWLSPAVNDIMGTWIGQSIIDRATDNWINREWKQ